MIDIKKAFDTVSWEFLLELLLKLGFPSTMNSWIQECISTVTFSIALNGKMHGFYKSKRGLRQGDPISPYLFVLAMEYLSRPIKVATANPNFNCHPKCEKIGLTHLSFADDIVLFPRGDVQSISILYDTLQQFGQCSGLEINLSKTKLFAAGISETELQEMLQITGFTKGAFPVRYLGTPLVYDKLKNCHFNHLVEKIAKFFNDWSVNSLSYAGRLELLKSVIQGIESFWIQHFPIPSGVLDMINKLCRTFLWAGLKPKVAWTSICTPKDEGGL